MQEILHRRNMQPEEDYKMRATSIHFRSIRSYRMLWVATFAVTLFASCDHSNSASGEPEKPAPVIVSAAASTSDVLAKLGAEFTANSKVEVKVNPGPSSGLASQIIAGAPADLFLSANRKWADEVISAKLAADSCTLLTNELVLIVPRGNPAHVHQPKDLLEPRLHHLALASESAPAGIYADQALSHLGLLDELTAANKVARAQDVRGALSFVERGEAEAGIVYATDAATSSAVEIAHHFDPAIHDQIVYVLVLLQGSNSAGKEFYQFLRTEHAAKTFSEVGFQILPNSKDTDTSP